MRLFLFLTLGYLTLFTNQAFSQQDLENFWSFKEIADSSNQVRHTPNLPEEAKHLSLDLVKMNKALHNGSHMSEGFEIALPNPKGEFEDFVLFETHVVSSDVSDAYSVKTFKGYLKSKPSASIRLASDKQHFNAFIFNGKNCYTIEKTTLDPIANSYTTYYKEDKQSSMSCRSKSQSEHFNNSSEYVSTLKTPDALRTYRLAIAAASDYADQWGGNPFSMTNVLNSIAMGVNMINEVFEKDLGVTFVLVSDESLVYEDVNQDPFEYDDDDLLELIHEEIEWELGFEGFDVGHLVAWADYGGVAYAAGCQEEKGSGFSSSEVSLWELYVAFCCHEIGHQLGADHTFSADDCDNSEDGYRFEVSHGSTMMGYADVGCGDVYQSLPDPYFHSESITQMHGYMEEFMCFSPGSSSLNTSSPVVDAGQGIVIPKETPFVLVGAATDSEPSITYSWEQADGIGAPTFGIPNCNSDIDPLFRVFPPVTDPCRIFPVMSAVLTGNNTNELFEQLPCTERNIKFNLVARDNNTSWGRTGQDQMTVTVANTGPFDVLSPNGGESWTNAVNTVTWSVNGTDSHCSFVDILLTMDDGLTYTNLASNIDNTGSFDIVLGDLQSDNARILVQCAIGQFKSRSTFFDISNSNFTIDIMTTSTEEYIDFDVAIYPNPTQHTLFVDLDSTTDYTINLYDTYGVNRLATSKDRVLNLEGLANGIYFLEIINNGSKKKSIKKIVKK